MTTFPISRRGMLTGSAAVAAAAAAPGAATAVSGGSRAAGADGFEYEIARSEAEWKEMLSEEEFYILRQGGTETPKTHPNWDREEEGVYFCRGCDLPLYQSDWKRQPGIGWAFFQFGEENSVLMGIDDFGGMNDENAPEPMIEAHCRRCGSHLGHIVAINNVVLHCINGRALTFTAASA